MSTSGIDLAGWYDAHGGTSGRITSGSSLSPGVPFGVARVHTAHCPERVLAGRVIREFIENDGIIGEITEASAEHAEAVYRVLLQGQTFRTDGSTAQLVELVKNASTGGHGAVLVAPYGMSENPARGADAPSSNRYDRADTPIFVALRKSLSLDRTRPT